MAPKCSSVFAPAGTDAGGGAAAGEGGAVPETGGDAPGARLSGVIAAPHSAQKLALWESGWPQCMQRRSLVLPLFPIVTA
jgi:hypothetical protein